MEINIENINIIYIGSARVWRKSKSEMGARKCLALNIDCDSITKKYIDLKSAGEYRVYNLNINDIDLKIENIYKNWNYKDIIDINIYGIIEDEILLENNLTPTYLSKEMQNYVEYQTSSGTAKVWIEDCTSITNRLSLVSTYDIAGSACWQFSQGTSEIWQLFDRYLQYRDKKN